MKLTEYLAQLNSADSQQGVWVNPENVDDYIVRPIMFGYNRQDCGDYVLIGSLDRLSFGFQSQLEAIECFLNDHQDKSDIYDRAVLSYNGRKVVVSIKGIIENLDNLDDDFRSFLNLEAEAIESTWARNEADLFIEDKLPAILQSAKEE